VVMLLRVRVWHEQSHGFVGGDYSVGWCREVCARGDEVFVHSCLSFG